MSSDLGFFAFVAFVACVTPGAGVLYTVTSSFRLGKSGAWAAPLGNCTGIIAMSIVSATGLGAVIQATPALFYGLQAVGALMLVWFGWKNWKAKPINLTAAGNNPAVEDKVRSHNLRSAYVGAMLLQTTNPMLIVFLLSLLPQFITPQHDYVSRMTTLISIFAAVGLTVHLGYGFVAAFASHHLQNKKFLSWVNKVSAVLFWLLAIGVFWSLFTMPQAA